MQQNDIIFLHFIHDTLCNDAGIICLPVERIDIPQHLDHFCLIIKIAFPAAVRRSDILRMFSGQSKNNLVCFVHLLHRRLIREIGKIHMFIGMNADEMSVCMDFLHDLGIFFTLRTQKKKSCLHIPLFQAFQKCLRMIRIWSIIKCQSHFLNFLFFDFS